MTSKERASHQQVHPGYAEYSGRRSVRPTRSDGRGFTILTPPTNQSVREASTGAENRIDQTGHSPPPASDQQGYRYGYTYHRVNPGSVQGLRWYSLLELAHSALLSQSIQLADGLTASRRGETEVLYARCAGIDIHKKTVRVCVLMRQENGKSSKEFRTYSTTTQDLLALLDWLLEKGCSHVALEGTGVYWKPVYNLLNITTFFLMADDPMPDPPDPDPDEMEATMVNDGARVNPEDKQL